MKRVYTIERDRDTVQGLRSTQRVATDAINAVIQATADRRDWHHRELTDQDDEAPQFEIDYPDDADYESFRVEFAKALQTCGVKVKNIDPPFRQPAEKP